MNVSENFQKVIGATIASVLVIAAALFIVTCINPPARVSAQNGGVVGIQAITLPVFSAQASTKSSAIFQDVGQGLNVLFVCNSGFSGSIDLEWSPTNVAPFYPLVTATYSADSTCHTLQVGGYFPNMRSTVTASVGSLSAWYSASSGPVSFAAPGVGSSGPTSPITCDQNESFGVSTGASYQNIAINPVNAGDKIVICGLTASFQGAASTGSLGIGFSTSAANCTTMSAAWVAYTTSSTPQLFSVPFSIRSLISTEQNVCVLNTSGGNVTMSIAWASVHL